MALIDDHPWSDEIGDDELEMIRAQKYQEK